MRITNYTPPIPGFGAADGWNLGGSLQWVEAEIRELEQKSERAKGKVHPHYQERLKELHNMHEILEGELSGLGTQEIPGASTQLIPYPQDLPGAETTSIQVEPEMSHASPPRMSGSPSSQERPWLGSDAKTLPWDKGVDVLSLEEGNSAEQQIKESKAQFSQENHLGSFLAKAQHADHTK